MSWPADTRWDKGTDPQGVHRVAKPYAALVAYDDGPGTEVKVALSAVWCRDVEARGHVERRMPELYVERGLLGKRVTALVCPASLAVQWAPNSKSAPTLVEQLRRHIGEGTEHANIRDGKVIDWFTELH